MRTSVLTVSIVFANILKSEHNFRSAFVEIAFGLLFLSIYRKSAQKNFSNKLKIHYNLKVVIRRSRLFWPALQTTISSPLPASLCSSSAVLRNGVGLVGSMSVLVKTVLIPQQRVSWRRILSLLV